MPTGQPTPADELSDDQRQGRACHMCHSSAPPLHPDGHAYLPAAPGEAALGYAVVVCTAHLRVGQ